MDPKKLQLLWESSFILGEIGRSISKANAKQITAAIKAMKDAMEVIAPLIAEDADEQVSEVKVESTLDPLLRVAGANYKKWELIKLGEAAKILAQMDSYDSIRTMVSNALRKRAISDALKSKVDVGDDIGYSDYYGYGICPYICDLYDGSVVYSLGGDYYESDYTISGSDVTLGDPTEVKISYVPVSNNTQNEVITVELKGELVQLQEKAVREDGTARIKLIDSGWGSSGYYSEKVLKRDGPKAFCKGTHMYMNHPTEEENRLRPERDVKDLAGVISSNVVWEDASPKNTGPGLYADVKVLPTYKEFIDEAAPFIGVSIRAAGTAVEGEADGHHGYIVDSLTEGYSVDYVTMAGRGGQVLSLYESARNKIVNVTIDEVTSSAIVEKLDHTEEGYNVEITKEELDALRESANKATTLETRLTETSTALSASQTTIARMQEAMILSEARTVVAATLATINMPNIVRERLTRECATNPPVTEDRTLDSDKLVEAVKTKAVEELKYLESVTGSVTNGKVIGMTAPATQELVEADVDKSLEEAWQSFGFDEKSSKIAAIGRN